VEEAESLAIELLEELVPGDLLKRSFPAVAGKIDPEDPRTFPPAGADY
jgi:hypothetical protein